MEEKAIASPEIKIPAVKGDWIKGSITGNLGSLSWPKTIISAVMMIGPTSHINQGDGLLN